MPRQVPYVSSREQQTRNFQEFEQLPIVTYESRGTSFEVHNATVTAMESTVSIPGGASVLVSCDATMTVENGAQMLIQLETVLPDGSTVLQPGAMVVDADPGRTLRQGAGKTWVPSYGVGKHVFRLLASNATTGTTSKVGAANGINMLVWVS
jgi:hypothetical protein